MTFNLKTTQWGRFIPRLKFRRLDNEYLTMNTTFLHQNQNQKIFSFMPFYFSLNITLSIQCNGHQMKNAVKNKSRSPGSQAAERGWDVESMQTCMSFNSLEVYCSASPQYSHLPWLLSRTSLSRLTELSSTSELRLGQRLHTEDSISHRQPHRGQGDRASHAGVSVARPSTILCSSRSLTVLLGHVELPLLSCYTDGSV